MKFRLLLFTFALATLAACSVTRQANPAAAGFDSTGSDAKAIEIAGEVMAALGGRKNWDATRYLTWNFFGRRTHYWDKWTGDVRIESPGDSTIYLVNIHTLKGRVQRNGVEETNPDTLAALLQQAKEMWINDAYWLVMPFKLKDSGVTLKYTGEGKTEAGSPADVLQLTFKNVGVTPDNKYLVYVDKDSRRVTQWSYFRKAENHDPDFSTPWQDYQKYGKIWLSGNRGRASLTNIAAPEELPESLFREF
ncbi:MAG: hypothetical protein ACE5FF_12030 [Saprospiraceae bacterium]